MPRIAPPDRLSKLLDVAAEVFVEHGFQRAQMDDIAERLGVSKGTIYRSVESKESLFAAVLAWADDPEGLPAAGPIATVDMRTLAGTLAADLASALSGLELTAVLAAPPAASSAREIGREIERLVVDLYRTMDRRRTTIMVLDRCAAEIPELAPLWFGEGRYALVDLWSEYLEVRTNAVGPAVERSVLARTIVEIVTTWAVKMRWDRAPRPYPTDNAAACAAMVRNLVTGGAR